MKMADVGSSLNSDIASMTGIPEKTVRRVLRALPRAIVARIQVHGRAGITGFLGITLSDSRPQQRLVVKLHKSFRDRFKSVLLVLFLAGLTFSISPYAEAKIFSPPGQTDFTPTPLLVGQDDAPARIVIYDALNCPACAHLEQQIALYRNFLYRNHIAIEFRLLSLNEQTIRRNAFVLSECMNGQDTLATLFRARQFTPSRDYARLRAIRSWIQWYESHARRDGVYYNKDGRMTVRTPTSFVLINYKPVARIPPGISNIELLLAPLYDIGYLKEEYHGQ